MRRLAFISKKATPHPPASHRAPPKNTPKRQEKNPMTNRLQRINELAAIAKKRPLTEEETKERDTLRKEYLAQFRANFRGILDNTSIKRPDGSLEPLQKKK